MNLRKQRFGTRDPGLTDPVGRRDERAYALLEETRLYCERLAGQPRSPDQEVSLSGVHRELGMAGLLASSEITPDRRLALLAAAHHQATRAKQHPAQARTLAGVAILAEDAVAGGLTTSRQSDHMHLAHLHVLKALELLSHQL